MPFMARGGGPPRGSPPLWCLPPSGSFVAVLHTASHEKGQIYIPVVNWSLAVVAAVLLFGSSDALGGAYGIAVSMLMAVSL